MSNKTCYNCKHRDVYAWEPPCSTCSTETFVNWQPVSFGEPAPIPNTSRPIWELVVEDMKARNEMGKAKYGVPLQAHNGRNALKDAYEEVLDLAAYLKQKLVEENGV